MKSNEEEDSDLIPVVRIKEFTLTMCCYMNEQMPLYSFILIHATLQYLTLLASGC